MSITVTHNAGFFSCCSVLLHKIIEYINKNNTLPVVNSSAQFAWYKPNTTNRDITYDYFEHYNNVQIEKIPKNINYVQGYQFSLYNVLDYEKISPIIKKYFTPSVEISDTVKQMESKYKLDYKNICVLFYRGNDKNRETKICSYDQYLEFANKVLSENPNAKFLIQSDETEFITFMRNAFPNNSFYFTDEIRHMPKCNSTVDLQMRSDIFKFSKLYLAITIIMSKCETIICGSGNCSIWIMLFRGNSKNVYQNLNNKWYYHVN